MDHVLLSVHVLAAIVFVGGSAVAASLFPRYAPVAGDSGGERSRAVAAALHRITGGYAAFGLIVPAAGIALAIAQGRMGEIWITVSMVLTAVAGLLLATQIHPRQRRALDTPGEARELRILGMLAGVYNLAWAVVVVLMIVRPGTEAAA
ncbi:hypothetical protein [Bailinhaonella thermotolerans]|uniref:DUF2269 family protein n=1 Tax=Bailinhaonella thermotolerans TaxID=1070861 RepID=A0A3A4ATX5_9ACTN|nr:hypothetical protein [Bailinhaonella thermotolerans]RJL22992.1 hypothetical protein D5H75_33965 [Bailinhaonella thermotolerans]